VTGFLASGLLAGLLWRLWLWSWRWLAVAVAACVCGWLWLWLAAAVAGCACGCLWRGCLSLWLGLWPVSRLAAVAVAGSWSVRLALGLWAGWFAWVCCGVCSVVFMALQSLLPRCSARLVKWPRCRELGRVLLKWPRCRELGQPAPRKIAQCPLPPQGRPQFGQGGL
jgi:hypothetical protein